MLRLIAGQDDLMLNRTSIQPSLSFREQHGRGGNNLRAKGWEGVLDMTLPLICDCTPAMDVCTRPAREWTHQHFVMMGDEILCSFLEL